MTTEYRTIVHYESNQSVDTDHTDFVPTVLVDIRERISIEWILPTIDDGTTSMLDRLRNPAIVVSTIQF